jgi:hypothetical protein
MGAYRAGGAGPLAAALQPAEGPSSPRSRPPPHRATPGDPADGAHGWSKRRAGNKALVLNGAWGVAIGERPGAVQGIAEGEGSGAGQIKGKGKQMRRIKIAGLCLVAALVASVAVAATASAAAPELGRCVKNVAVEKKFSGSYSDSKCTKAVSEAEREKKGKYEWLPGPGANNGFTTSGGAATLTTKGGKTVTCTSEKSSGEYIAGGDNKHEKTVVEFAGCKSNGFACTTAGKSTGELVTNELLGEVGYEVAAKKKTALKLYPAPSAKGKFIEFKCVGLEIKVRGKGEEAGAGILVNIKNDKMTTTEALKYKASKGIQKPVKWEGPNPETYLESNFENLGYEQSGQTITSTVKNEEAIELNAVI